MCADNRFHSWRSEAHGLGYRSQMRMRSKYELCVAASTAQSRGGKPSFGAFATGKNKFAATDGHAMKLRRIIEAEETAFHRAAGCEFREHGGEMAAGTLNAARCVQFRKYADEHWLSLPSAGMERKREHRESGLYRGQSRDDVDEAVQIEIGGMSEAIMDAETVVHHGGEHTGIACGLHVDFGVADEERFVGARAEFAKNGVSPERIGLFCGKTVSAVDGAKIFGKTECFQDTHADVNGFIGEYGHGHGGKMMQRFGDAGIGASVVHLVLFVMG
jgi:hypothetical protein